MEEKLLQLLEIALKYQVSDIHFTMIQEKLTIEMRIQGQMRTLQQHDLDGAFFRYLQYIANLDISHCSTPQTGQFEVNVMHQLISLRFAVVNTLQQKVGVLRLLNKMYLKTLEEIFIVEKQQLEISDVLCHSNGLFILSGPTGSGKTTTLYAMMNAVKQRKIYTLEDPIEIYFDHVTQLQVGQNLSYADGIKQILRHDPDLIVIGEIRDSITAKMAIRSALTGHLVLATIHSFSCKGTFNRLQELGIEISQLKEVLLGISCQRLIYHPEKRFCIFELCNRKEVYQYCKTGKFSDEFQSLSCQLQNLFTHHIIDEHTYQKELSDFE